MEDDDTPISPARARRLSSNVTQWGIVEAWLAHGNRMFTGRLERGGLTMRVIDDGAVADELVRPDEDPSAALVRAIGKM